MPRTGRGARRKAARMWTVTGMALLGAAAVPAAAGATTAQVEGDVIRIVDTAGIDDRIVISAGGIDTDGVAWNISGVDGLGEFCQGTGDAVCTDGRFGGGGTRRFEIDLGEGEDELEYLVSSGHSGDEPEGTIRLGADDDELETRGLEAHPIDAGAGDDLITLAGFGLSGAGGPTSGSAPADIVLDGGTGRDTFDMGRRRSGDVVLGGPGADVVTYAERTPAVSVTLDGLANDGTGGEGDDIAADVEELVGTAANDTLIGATGDQVIDGGRGADTLDGAQGADALSFLSRSTAVAADLGAGTTIDGDAIAGFENLFGGTGGDTLTGDAGANRIMGAAGVDVMRGGAGPDAMFGGTGDDFMDGGPGTAPDLFVGDGLSSDTADYRLRAERVEVTLPPMFVPPGVAGEVTTLDGDRLQQISNVLGGSGADRLIGNNGPNELRGGRGDDKLDGRGGDDVLRGDGGRDVIGALRPFPSGVCTFVLGQGQVCTLDYFVANPAPDGRDTMLGGPDGDQISARDLAPDERIDCGTGTDGARRDAIDPAAAGCESQVTG